MAMLEMPSGRTADATARLREALQISAGTGGWLGLANGLDCCGYLCAVTGRWAEAVTVWAASAALLPHANPPSVVRRRQELLLEARQALGPARIRSAEDRGTAMSWSTAAEYALLLTAPAPGPLAAATGTGLGRLSARERELVTLVAQGRTDAEIAVHLFISIRTVRSHLDRIRDKTGCRRRADLTRLALSAGLV
jgi:DNA-binding CsgD family transcriptional regulator